MRLGIAILATLLIGLVAFAEEEKKPAEKPTAEPKKAPDFELLDLDGKKRTLKEFKGKTVVLEWCNYGCPFVQKHYGKSGNMPALQKRYTKKDVIWLAICSTNPNHRDYRDAKALKEMNKKRKAAPTAMLLDVDGKVGRAYKAKTTPHMIIIDKSGTIVYDGAIDSVKSANPAHIKDATNYVSEVLDAMLANKKVLVAQTTPYGCGIKYAKKRRKQSSGS